MFFNTNLHKNPKIFKILRTWKVTDILNELSTFLRKLSTKYRTIGYLLANFSLIPFCI